MHFAFAKHMFFSYFLLMLCIHGYTVYVKSSTFMIKIPNFLFSEWYAFSQISNQLRVTINSKITVFLKDFTFYLHPLKLLSILLTLFQTLLSLVVCHCFSFSFPLIPSELFLFSFLLSLFSSCSSSFIFSFFYSLSITLHHLLVNDTGDRWRPDHPFHQLHVCVYVSLTHTQMVHWPACLSVCLSICGWGDVVECTHPQIISQTNRHGGRNRKVDRNPSMRGERQRKSGILQIIHVFANDCWDLSVRLLSDQRKIWWTGQLDPKAEKSQSFLWFGLFSHCTLESELSTVETVALSGGMLPKGTPDYKRGTFIRRQCTIGISQPLQFHLFRFM